MSPILQDWILFAAGTVCVNSENKDQEGFKIFGFRFSKRLSLGERVFLFIKEAEKTHRQLNFKVFLFLVLGMLGLAIGANYLIESVLKLAELFRVTASFIAITAYHFRDFPENSHLGGLNVYFDLGSVCCRA